MDGSRGSKTPFLCIFLLLNLVVGLAVVFWTGPYFPKHVFQRKNEDSYTTLPGITSFRVSSTTQHPDQATTDVTADKEVEQSEAYFEKQFKLSPGEQLRKRSDELRNLTPAQYYEKLNHSLVEAQKRKLIIIEVWKPTYGRRKPSFLDFQCGLCQIEHTLDKSNDSRTKALVYHFQMTNDKFLPSTRRPDQYYVWQTRESSTHVQFYKINLTRFNNFFNMTMTPRRYGDIFDPYGTGAALHQILPNLPMKDEQIDEMISKKDRLGLWIVSNCGSYTGLKGAKLRMAYAKKLIAFGLDLELGGKCFQNKRTDKDMDYKRFKFYLAFENSWNCSDYITEKFWRNSFEYGPVPVVLGAAKSDYIETAPPNSFIYAQDFESPEKLAEYLLHLDKNNTAYKEYHMWRKLKVTDMPYYRRAQRMCQLCRVLNGINIDNLFNTKFETRFKHIPMFGLPSVPRIIPSLEEYLYKDENEGCNDFPPK